MRSAPKALRSRVVGLLGCAALLVLVSQAPAQPGRRAGKGAGLPENEAADAAKDEGLSGGLILAADRAATHRLQQARDLLTEGRYSEAAQVLGLLLENPEDYFFQPDPQVPVHKSVKSEAERMIGALPAEGLAAYRLLFEAQARAELRDALDSGDQASLARLSRQFLHTEAGAEATWFLARRYLDQGRALASAMCLERLVRCPTLPADWRPALLLQSAAAWRSAGQPSEASRIVADFLGDPEAARSAAIAAARQSAEEPAPAIVERLLGLYDAAAQGSRADEEGWLLYRGSPQRNTESAGGAPLLSAVWKLRLASEPAIEKLLTQVEQGYATQRIPLLPAAQPLVVRDVVLARNANTLVAADFFSGKRLWEVPVEETFESFLEQSGRAAQVSAPLVLAGLEQRVWDDATFGALASDGERVFLIDDLGVAPGLAGMELNANRIAINLRQRQTRPRDDFNRLAAYDVATGKLQWEVGGAPGPRALPLAETFFLGAPLPLAGELYALAEQNSEIRLLALDAATGRLDWSQPLSVLERSVSQELLRRLAGVSPSFSDGVLICPTAAGGVVAIDLTARALLWGYRYRNLAEDGGGSFGGNFNVRPAMILPGQRRSSPLHWVDSTATVVGQRVLLTPVESDEIHCLDLRTGELLWHRPRADGLYLAAVHGDRVVIVGAKQVQLLNLANGRPLATEGIALPGGALPSGRGFLTGNLYYLPLSDGQIAAIDVEAAKLAELSRSRRSATTPGNLICHRGTIISQSAQSVETYYQQSALEERLARMLKENPDDPRALTLRGELALGQGRLDDALGDLRQAVAQNNDNYARRLLAETLLDGLSRDFARFEPEAAQLQEMLEAPSQKARLAQLMAAGWHSQGKIRDAMRQYLAIANGDEPHALLAIEPGREVRADRWVRAGLSALAESASEADRAEIARQIAERYAAAVKAGTPYALARCLDFFGDAPQALSTRVQLALATDAKQHPLDVERLWLAVLAEGNATEQARAARALAQLYVDQGALDAAGHYYRLLSTQYRDVEIERGRRGADVVSSLPPNEPLRAAIEAPRSWPADLVGIERLAQGGPVLRFFDVPQLRAPMANNAEWSLSIDQRGQYLLAHDGLGREAFRALLTEPADRMGPGLQVTISQSQIFGHLVLVSMGDEVVAIDASPQPGQRLARVLWRHSLVDTLPGWTEAAGIRPGVEDRPWGVQRMTAFDAVAGRAIGSMGPITRDVVAIERARRIEGLDPVSGATLWSRSDLPAGADLFGDDELLFVAGPTDAKAVVVRMSDGQRLGERALPARSARMTHLGRKVLCWTPAARDSVTLQLFDPWTQEVAWSAELGRGAKANFIEGDELVVIEPKGRVRVFDIATGQTRVDAEVEADSRLQQALVLRSRDEYVIVGNRQWINDGRIFVVPIPGGLDNPVISGQMWGFRRSDGQKLWSKKIERQALLLTQPSQTPVVVLASRLFDRGPAQPMGNDNAGNQAQFLVIDRRTGETLLEEKAPGNITSYELTATPENRSVTLRFMRTALQFRFGSKKDAPAKASSTKPSGQERKS